MTDDGGDNVVRMRRHPSVVRTDIQVDRQEQLERLKLVQQQVLTVMLFVVSVGTAAFVLGLVVLVWRFVLTF